MNLMKFDKAKCKFLHLGEDNLESQCRLGNEWIENHPVEKDFGILVDRTQKRTLAAQEVSYSLGCITRSVSSRLKVKEGRFKLDIRKNFCKECDETLELVSQSFCGCLWKCLRLEMFKEMFNYEMSMSFQVI